MHSNINNVSWAFWLAGKGYTEKANLIIEAIETKDTSVLMDLEILYHFNSSLSNEWSKELYEKDVLIWAEFLTATDTYIKRTTKWFKEYPNG